jgi:hypothetical protein
MMKPSRRTRVRRSFLALVTGAGALALQACGDAEQTAGNNSSDTKSEQATDSDSG